MATSKTHEVTQMNDATETNCTRVASSRYGLVGFITFRDHEIRKLKSYIKEMRAKGYTVTTERGVWID